MAPEGRADREGCYDPEKIPKFMATKYVAITTEASFKETVLVSEDQQGQVFRSLPH